MESSNWDLIASFDQEFKVVICVEILAENDIVSRYENRHDTSFLIGSFDLYVRSEFAEKAKELINKANL